MGSAALVGAGGEGLTAAGAAEDRGAAGGSAERARRPPGYRSFGRRVGWRMRTRVQADGMCAAQNGRAKLSAWASTAAVLRGRTRAWRALEDPAVSN
jgi:hypothetical protein